MKRITLLLLTTLFFYNGFGQSALLDRDFKNPPTMDLENLDSVSVIQIFKAEQIGKSRKPLEGQGFLELEIALNDEQQMTSWKRFNSVGSKAVEGYQFEYPGEKDIFIQQTLSQSSKKYTWLLRDTLIQEIKMFKGKKQKSVWEYTYMHDTLLTTVVKFDKSKNIAYQLEYEYSDTYELVGRTIIEKGQPTRRSEATYDIEGNMTGYTFTDLKKDTEVQKVLIQRDSSDQVSVVDYKTRKGKKESLDHTYNERGSVQSSLKLSADTTILERIDYKYDARDNVIQRSHTINDVVKERYDWEYDDRDNMISRHYYKRFLGNLDLMDYLILAYDQKNRLIRKDHWNKMYNTRMRWDYRYLSF